MRVKTPSFVAEFPLHVSPAQTRELNIRLDAARHCYNACLTELLRRLRLMRETCAWQAALAMPKGKERSEVLKRLNRDFSITAPSIQKFAETCRDSCWIGDHLGSHDTQTTSKRAFSAVMQYAFGKRGRPRFKKFNTFTSIEGKGDAVLRFRAEPQPTVHYAGLAMPLRLDLKDKCGWQVQALSCPTKYVRIVRRAMRGRTYWYAQLVQEGWPPQTRAVTHGVVGLDLGPSTIAVVSGSDAILEKFCPEIDQPWGELRRLERGMDRSRRATNPANYDHKGRIKSGRRQWHRSNRYRKLALKRREHERRLAAARKRAHGELANRVLGQGTTIKTEKLSYKSFQKNYGRSTQVRAPGMFVSELRRKAESAGGVFIEINTRSTKLSQFDHTTGEYIKKPLSQRTHVFGDGKTEPVQRDLYSAFLARCCDETNLDINQVLDIWSAAEPLLRCAMARTHQPASRPGFALPHVEKASELVAH